MPAEFGFLWPYAAFALPLPWLLRRWMSPIRGGPGSLWVPVLSDYVAAACDGRSAMARWPSWGAIGVWCLLVVAVMRPVWIDTVRRVPLTGRNLWVAIDLSSSMGQTDFDLAGRRVTRLHAAKRAAAKFIAARHGDRVGLVVFGTHAYVQAPLTLDRRTVEQLLAGDQVGMAGGKTSIGDAIGLIVKRVQTPNATPGQQVVVLLSDGIDTAGALQPGTAARLAAQRKIKIYTIGLNGTPSVGTQGMTALRLISTLTGGRFALASSAVQLKHVFLAIDRAEPAARPEFVSVYTALYPWPAGLALLAVLLAVQPLPWARPWARRT